MENYQGKYFLVSREAVRAIREHESDESNGLLQAAFLVICKCTNKDGFTFASGNAISKILPRTGRPRANQLLDNLRSICLDNGKPVITDCESKGSRKNIKPYVGQGIDTFCIPNFFVDAKGLQGASESHLTKICRASKPLRKIALSSMIEAYAEYNPMSYWGCNPMTSLYIEYPPYENEDYNIKSEMLSDKQILRMHSQEPIPQIQYSFAETVLSKPRSEISDTDIFNIRAGRELLLNLGTIFKQTIVFDGDPLSTSAEPLYLNYCHQEYIRGESKGSRKNIKPYVGQGKKEDPAFYGHHSKTIETLDAITDCRFSVYKENDKCPFWVSVSSTDYDPHLIGLYHPYLVAQTEDELLKQAEMRESAVNFNTFLGQ